ncbi:hypothetical protein LGV61_12365 [Desulfurispirillum indicum]|uniref:cytochrome c3 family protein n=1 Tax=Desulfurispirillum indicum TaxID=936456 RepID=UPI001CFB9D7B|nr:cytochrome c3 family protein [Desulfurispirillum indicum]UCZ56506.1 hypothetical protein LGV61_12365 [Desulfurispirillum indicum]
MKQIFRILIPFSVLLAALFLIGCGSESRDAGLEFSGGCASCHETVTAKWSETHGNLNETPDYTLITVSARCKECHDPGDFGLNPPQGYGQMRPMVSCQSCHTSENGQHPSAMPDRDICSTCHNVDVPNSHASKLNNNFMGISERFEQSSHATSYTSTNARCASCHTDEGFRAYWQVQYTDDGQRRNLGRESYIAEFENETAMESATSISCQTCHEPHTGAIRARENAEFSRSFNLCTSCHQVFVKKEGSRYVLDEAVYGTSGVEPDWDGMEYHSKRAANDRVIANTHFAGAFPTVDSDGNYTGHTNVSGYNIDASAANACIRCHNPHRP